MLNQASLTERSIPKPHYLWFLILTYTMVMTLANWFDPRLINIFGINTDAGILVFPLTFLLSDLITEVYGYKFARQAIWCGFLFNAIFIIYGQIVINMPSPSYATNNQVFDSILATNIRIILASTVSYLISEPLNSMIMAKLKIKMKGRYIGIRFITSTAIASGPDSFLFGVIAFYGTMSNINLFYLISSIWFIKIFIELLGLPISTRLAVKLKRLEKLDVYDKNTDFNLFSLNTHYDNHENEFLTSNQHLHIQ